MFLPHRQANVFAHRQAGMVGIKACRLAGLWGKNTLEVADY